MCALRVEKCEFSVYKVRIFMKRTHVCAAQTTYKFFTKLLIEPDFPCLADEIAEPRPDMNIKVTAFTVSEKSINTDVLVLKLCMSFLMIGRCLCVLNKTHIFITVIFGTFTALCTYLLKTHSMIAHMLENEEAWDIHSLFICFILFSL